MEKLNILVTGGGGFIGSHLADALLEQGHRVRIYDRQVAQSRLQQPHPLVEIVCADICDAEKLRLALQGIDVVYHLAAELGIGKSMYDAQTFIRANSHGTAILLEEIVKRRNQVRKIVVASSMSVYGEGAYRCANCGVIHPPLRPAAQLLARRWEVECPHCARALVPAGVPEETPFSPTSIYAITKQDQEQLTLVVGRAYDIPSVALRYFNVYGPGQALSNPYTGVCAIFCSRILNDQPPIIFEDGKQTRDFVHVRDVVRANLLALQTSRADFQALNIGTGTAISVNQVAQILADGLGRSVQPEIVGKYRQGDIRHCTADISRARLLLGYEPQVTLREGMSDLVDWVRTQTAQDQVFQAKAELEAHQLIR